jgi:hypothetical protein
MVMNDIVYLLDEAFTGLEKIHKHEDDVSSGIWEQLPVSLQQDTAAELQQVKRSVIFLLHVHLFFFHELRNFGTTSSLQQDTAVATSEEIGNFFFAPVFFRGRSEFRNLGTTSGSLATGCGRGVATKVKRSVIFRVFSVFARVPEFGRQFSVSLKKVTVLSEFVFFPPRVLFFFLSNNIVLLAPHVFGSRR